MRESSRQIMILVFAASSLLGCPEDVPPATLADRSPDRAPFDAGPECLPSWTLPDVGGNNASCQPLATDYLPGGADGWDPCLSDADANNYSPLSSSISSLARVAAFESMITRLLTSQPPTASVFIDAKLDYTQPEGLDSRVSIREDEHVPAAAKKCQDMTPAEIQQNADRCVGAAKMQPILNQAFLDGAAGKDPLRSAAKIESTLLWFLYLSVYKEATTCATKAQDCDSSYAYYTGGESRSGGKGLARYVRSVSTQAHDRIFDGILALRCWRDLDQGATASNLTLRDRARGQLDRGLHRGMALLVRSRIKAVQAACGRPREALWAGLQILGGALDRQATARDPSSAQVLRAELAKSAANVADLGLLDQTLEKIFPCP